MEFISICKIRLNLQSVINRWNASEGFVFNQRRENLEVRAFSFIKIIIKDKIGYQKHEKLNFLNVDTK